MDEKKPSEMIQNFLEYLDFCKCEYQSNKENMRILIARRMTGATNSKMRRISKNGIDLRQHFIIHGCSVEVIRTRRNCMSVLQILLVTNQMSCS